MAAMAVIAVALGGTAAYAVSTIFAVGTIQYFEAFNGPASAAVVDLTSVATDPPPAWHYHPGNGFVIVKSGSLMTEDVCGGAQIYTAGQAFFEEEGHIHRATPTLGTNYVFASVVPQGLPRSIAVPAPVCVGPPVGAAECNADGWRSFTVPRVFKNHGDCVSFTMNGK
jgi:quercetin dioxygenase-like cupin family protein